MHQPFLAAIAHPAPSLCEFLNPLGETAFDMYTHHIGTHTYFYLFNLQTDGCMRACLLHP
jgi:hypothetical protein